MLDSYWGLAAERQRIYYARLNGAAPPWTDDPVVTRYRFTNAFRAADRVSQQLIQRQYAGSQTSDDVVFRTLLFRLFNRPSTFDALAEECGDPTTDAFDADRYAACLDNRLTRGERIYSAAYIIPPPQFGAVRKHANHLRLIRFMLDDGIVERLAVAQSLSEVFAAISSYPSLGPFLAFQLTVDLNYSPLINFDEDDFVVAGPGARSGIAKCFPDRDGLSDAEIVTWMVDTQEQQCADIGLKAPTLFGRRLKLIDCQNLFCEIDKYARVAHPDVAGVGNRTRIKQEFMADPAPLPTPFFPPKWGLRVRLN